MIHQEEGILSSPLNPHKLRYRIPAHNLNKEGPTHDEEFILEEDTNLKTNLPKTTKQKYRSLKEIIADTDPLQALMIDLGDEEYSNSSQPGEKDEMILGENVSLTSSEAIDSPFKHE